MLDDAMTYLFTDKSIYDGVDSWWNDDEQDADKLLDIWWQWRKSVTYNNDHYSYLVEYKNNKMGCAGLKGLTPDATASSALFHTSMQDSEGGKSNDEEDASIHSPENGHT